MGNVHVYPGVRKPRGGMSSRPVHKSVRPGSVDVSSLRVLCPPKKGREVGVCACRAALPGKAEVPGVPVVRLTRAGNKSTTENLGFEK